MVLIPFFTPWVLILHWMQNNHIWSKSAWGVYLCQFKENWTMWTRCVLLQMYLVKNPWRTWNFCICYECSYIKLRCSTHSVNGQVSWKKTKTAKYEQVKLVLTDEFQLKGEWGGFHLPFLLVKTILYSRTCQNHWKIRLNMYSIL